MTYDGGLAPLVASAVVAAAPKVAEAAPQIAAEAGKVASQAITTTGDIVGKDVGRQVVGIAGEQIDKTRQFAQDSINNVASTGKEAVKTVAEGVVKDDSEKKSENAGSGLTAWIRTAASNVGEVSTAVVTAPVRAVVRAAKGTADSARGLISSSYRADEVRRKEAAIKKWEAEIEQANALLPEYAPNNSEAVRLRAVIANDTRQIAKYRADLDRIQAKTGAGMDQYIVSNEAPIALDIAIAVVVIVLLVAGVLWWNGSVNSVVVGLLTAALIGLSAYRVWVTRSQTFSRVA